MSLLSAADVHAAELTDWRLLAGKLRARFTFDGFAPGAALVADIAAAADDANHHPDLGLAYGRVDVALVSHDVGGITERDVRLARKISDLAASHGVASDAASLQAIQWALDTPDPARIGPFWAAILGGEQNDDGLIVDPADAVPPLWFQDSDLRASTDRAHVDVYVPDEAVAGRLTAGLEAGGTVLTDEFAPAWWVLADADGNRACVCTWHEPGDDFPFAEDVRRALAASDTTGG